MQATISSEKPATSDSPVPANMAAVHPTATNIAATTAVQPTKHQKQPISPQKLVRTWKRDYDKEFAMALWGKIAQADSPSPASSDPGDQDLSLIHI